METILYWNAIASSLSVTGMLTLFGLIWRLHSKQLAELRAQNETLGLFTSSYIMQEYAAMKEGLEKALERAKKERDEAQDQSAQAIAEKEQHIKHLESNLAIAEAAWKRTAEMAVPYRRDAAAPTPLSVAWQTERFDDASIREQIHQLSGLQALAARILSQSHRPPDEPTDPPPNGNDEDTTRP